ncbi:MAG: arginase [Acidobacteriota bacterium]|nr:MAG: arginase [Acidobacteriota bacterium]
MQTADKTIGLLGVPLGFGAGTLGSDLGVEAMRISNVRGMTLADHVIALGYGFKDHGDVPIVRPEGITTENGIKHYGAVLNSFRNIASSLDSVLQEGHMPIILGGDHSIAIATFSAISNFYRKGGSEVGLIWFDAHADINTPETSPSGNIHGMPLAALLGLGDDAIASLGGSRPKLDPTYFAHIGARDVDTGERQTVHDLGLRDQFFTMSDIDSRGMAACVADAIAIASKAPGGFAVTFDIDMIDPRFAPGSGTLVRGGTTYREAHLALEMIAANGGMISFEMVEVNPLLDQNNITVELAVELILSVLGKTIL